MSSVEGPLLANSKVLLVLVVGSWLNLLGRPRPTGFTSEIQALLEERLDLDLISRRGEGRAVGLEGNSAVTLSPGFASADQRPSRVKARNV